MREGDEEVVADLADTFFSKLGDSDITFSFLLVISPDQEAGTLLFRSN